MHIYKNKKYGNFVLNILYKIYRTYKTFFYIFLYFYHSNIKIIYNNNKSSFIYFPNNSTSFVFDYF